MQAIERLRERMPPAAKDIQLNLAAVLDSGTLEEQRRWGVALACAFSVGHPELVEAIRADSASRLDEGWVDDARAAAVLMGMNNVYYRFRHQVGKPSYASKPARLRMNRIAQPKSDRSTFELMCLAVSAINGCEACVRSHEQAVIEAGLTEDHVNDAVRIAATIRAAAVALSV